MSDAAYCNHCGASVRPLRTGVRYAGFWRRVLAVVIDLVLLAPAIEFGKEYFYLAIWRWDGNRVPELVHQLTPAEDQETTMTMMKQMAGFGTLIFFLAGPYYVLTEASALQGTLGKRILGLRVTDLDGRRVRHGRAIMRYLARMVSAIPWQFGFVMAAFTSKKQALHDVLTRTLVVIASTGEETDYYAARTPARTTCSSCSNEAPEGARYCSWCGAATLIRRAGARYGGFGRRLLALLLDLVVLAPIFVMTLSRFPPMSRVEFQAVHEFAGDQLTSGQREGVGMMMIVRFAYLCALVFAVSGAYCVLTERSALQGTLGKRALGLKVTDLHGGRIRLDRAFGRWIGHILSASLWMVGFLMAAFMPKRQALHDVLAGTLVVAREEKKSA